MTLKRSFPLLFMLLFFPINHAWGTEMALSANPAKVSLYQRILLTLQVTDGKLKSPPDIKGAGDLELTSSGTSTSFSFINGVSSSSTTYSFLLTANKTGTFAIHAVGEDEKGKLVSNTAEITVVETDTKQQAKDGLDKVFMKVELSSSEAYLHQQINYKLKFYTAYRIQETKLNLPEFEGFWVEDIGKEKQYQESVDGIEYQVYEINKALFPEKTGTFEFKSARIYCQVITQDRNNTDPFGGFSGNPFFNDPFFNNPFANTRLVDKTVVSGKTLLEVKALPEAPEGVTSELVGNFHLSLSLSKKELKVGESATLTVQITGDGNLALLELPDIELESIKLYKDKPVITQALHGDKLIYTKEFKIAIIPEKPGEVQLPTIEIPYFSTFEDRWITMQGKDLSLNVLEGIQSSLAPTTPETEPQTDPPRPKKVNVVGKDILPVYMNEKLYEEDDLEKTLTRIQLFALLLLLVFAASIAYYYRSYRPRFDENHLRRSRALSKALKSVDAAQGTEDLSLALRGYIGDKTGKSGTSLAREELKDLLKGSELAEEITGEVLKFYDELEASLYSGGYRDAAGLDNLKALCRGIIQKIDTTL